MTGIVTQGSEALDSWVEAYTVQYSHDGKAWNPVLDSATHSEKVSECSTQFYATFWLKYRVFLDFDHSLDMLEQYSVPHVHHCANLFGADAIYQLHGTPSHFCRAVRTCLDMTSPDAWIVHVEPNVWLFVSLI